MTVVMIALGADSLVTTDGDQRGCGVGALHDVTSDLTAALEDAIWTYMLRAELEEAFDSALLRAAFAETPTLTGTALFA